MAEVKATAYIRQTEVVFMPNGSTRERQLIFLRSDQPKPTVGVAYPDVCFETDTRKTSYFNNETRQWDY